MADVKFDIEVTGIKELRQAADNFQRLGKVSSQLSAQYKPLGAQTNRLVKEQRRLSSVHKSLNKAIKDGTISAKDATRAMQEEIRVSKERILTDKTLIDQAKKRAKAAADLARENEKLVKLYAPMRTAETQYKQAVKDVDQALERKIINEREHADAMRRLTFEYNQFTQGLATGGNQFAKFNVESYKANQRMKRFASVGMQQAGYQVGDFIVQIQSGTDALVAFGQQGSQLAGIFGAKGAIVGALIAGGTALAMVFKQYGEAAKGSAEDIKNAFSTVPDYFDDLGVSIYDAFDGSFSRIEERYGQLIANIARGELTKLQEAARSVEGPISKAAAPGFLEQLGAALAPGVVGTGTSAQGQVQAEIKAQTEEAYAQSVAVNKVLDLYRQQVGEVKSQAELFALVKNTYQEILGISEDAAKAFETQAKELGIAKAITDEIDASEEKRIATNKKLQQIQTDAMSMEAEVYEELRQEELKFAELKNRVRRYVIDVIAAAEREQAEKTTKLQNFLQETQNKERLKVLKTINDAEVAEAEKNANLQNFIFMGLAKRRRDVIATIAAAEKKFTEEQAKAAEKAAKAQAKIDDRARAALEVDRARARLSNAQVRFGKDSSQAREAELELVATQVIEAERLKNTSEDIVSQLIQAAQAHTKNKHSLEDQAEAARELEAAANAAARAFQALSNSGDNIEKALVKAKAEVKALKEGLDAANASTIAGFELDLKRKFEEAKEAATGPDGIIAATKEYKESLRELGELETTLAEKRKLESSSRGPAPDKVKDYIRSLKNQFEMEESLIGIFGEQRVLQEALIKARQEYGDIATDSQEEIIRNYIRETHTLQQQQQALEDARKKQEELAEEMSGYFGDAFLSIVDGTKSVKDAFSDMARHIIRRLYEILVVEQMVQSISGAIQGAMSPVQGPPAPRANANGNIFSRGSVVPFANGGVVGGPTYFPMFGGRTGLMGEAGPEAIMPLKRGKNGKLGVETSGQADNIVINQTFSFAANGDESVKRIIAKEAPKIAQMTQQQIMDSRRRGGQMKAVFG